MTKLTDNLLILANSFQNKIASMDLEHSIYNDINELKELIMARSRDLLPEDEGARLTIRLQIQLLKEIENKVRSLSNK